MFAPDSSLGSNKKEEREKSSEYEHSRITSNTCEHANNGKENLFN